MLTSAVTGSARIRFTPTGVRKIKYVYHMSGLDPVHPHGREEDTNKV